MQKLNLPDYNFQITRKAEGDFIFDIFRKKLILLTPEEWVRQHILLYLHKDLGYPNGLLKVESGVAYNKRLKRSDIIVFDNLGAPFMLVECKAPNVKINQATLEQAAMYNRTLKAPIVLLSNGLIHFTFKLDENGQVINLSKIPPYKA